jgi:hypothetical protein
MYIRCYSTWANISTQEQVWQVLRDKGWISAGPIKGYNHFYIPDHLVTWCLLIDPTLKHHPTDDWLL